MKTLLGVMGAASMAALIYLCITTAITERTVGKHANALAMQAGDTLKKVNTDLDEIHRATLELALTATEARKASVKESAYLDTWNRSVTSTIANLNATFLSVQHTSDVSSRNLAMLATNTSETIRDIRPVLSSATDELRALTAATAHLNAMMPVLNSTAIHANATMANVQDTTADAKEWMHGVLHPTLFHKIWGVILNVGGAIKPW